jgi:AcrR family transcriptional regulator
MAEGIAKSGMRMSGDERRREVLVAASQAFARGGYAGTSTEEIAQLAGISQPYLFRLFKTKKALFLAVAGYCFDRITDRFLAAAEGHRGDEAIEAMGLAYLDLMADGTFLLLQLHSYAASADPEIRAFVGGRFSELVSAVRSASGVDEEALRQFFATGMLLNVIAALHLDDFGDLSLPVAIPKI